MAGNLGRLNPQYYQASGEATPQAQLPEQFRSNNPPASPLSGHLAMVTESYADFRQTPIVHRVERTLGMRNLYRRGATRQPIQRLGADGTPIPWDSSFQPNDMGPIRNCHFNDALFQAGYPGFNLGISFKVQTLPTQSGQTTRPQVQAPAMINISTQPSS